MTAKQLLNEILYILRSIKDDKGKLEKTYRFLMDEIYEEPQKTEIPGKYKPLVTDLEFQQQLINALNRKRPFANFKWLIDNSDYRQDWFDYRQARFEQYVYELIENE